MAFAYKDRVKETTTTTGTGTITLAGAVTGFRAFQGAFSASDTMYYVIDGGSGEWEVGLGTLATTTTLARTTVLSSSNAGSAVNFSAGTKNVWCDVPASALIASGVTLSAAGAITALSVAGGTVTSSTPVLDATQTWNSGGTTFTGLKLNVTDTASASASLLMDLQKAGTSYFNVRKDGLVTVGDSGGFSNANLNLRYGSGIGPVIQVNGSHFLALNNTTPSSLIAPAFTMGSGITSTPDVWLVRDAANTLALRNSTSAQTFNWYFSYTDSSNYTRGALKTSSGVVELAAESAGTGTANIDVKLTTKGTGVVQYGTHSAIAAETVTGYITIKDAGGTTRKIAVVS